MKGLPGRALCGLVNDPTMDDSRPRLPYGRRGGAVLRVAYDPRVSGRSLRRETQVLFDIVV